MTESAATPAEPDGPASAASDGGTASSQAPAAEPAQPSSPASAAEPAGRAARTPHPAATLLERLADRLGARASVTTVYGEPITRGDVTVIPVARVGLGFGGGTGRALLGPGRNGEGGGGGGGVEARPVGFIEITGGAATYKPIRDPWADVAVPLAGLLLGSALPQAARALLRRRR